MRLKVFFWIHAICDNSDCLVVVITRIFEKVRVFTTPQSKMPVSSLLVA